MKSISVLGTSSNSGKSWLVTALCALFHEKGVRVTPFKAQNMSNQSFATLDGGEIGRAQAAQAEACGLIPTWEMNPVLLKPSGKSGSQVVVRGKAERHLSARDYYKAIDHYWEAVAETLDTWGRHWDLLVMEGAGSPVELNLMDRDIANLKPMLHVDGRWILCADIERGGVFAQIVGTWSLLPVEIRRRCLGIVVNKFRGDLSLFEDAEKCLKPHVPAPFLGTLPYLPDLQPEAEDSLSADRDFGDPEGDVMAWIRLPHLSNATDAEPWKMDRGVRVRWVRTAAELRESAARAVILPGTKNSLADLRWLKEGGMAEAIREMARREVSVAGICGGYQILGETIDDPEGIAGDAGIEQGLGLLPLRTAFQNTKTVSQIEVSLAESAKGPCWKGYEIHMGESAATAADVPPLLSAAGRPEGMRREKIWGTYVHGLFDHPACRTAFSREAGMEKHEASPESWADAKGKVYRAMGQAVMEHLNLSPIFEYVGIR